jgi:hypothetical protein
MFSCSMAVMIDLVEGNSVRVLAAKTISKSGPRGR